MPTLNSVRIAGIAFLVLMLLFLIFLSIGDTLQMHWLYALADLAFLVIAWHWLRDTLHRPSDAPQKPVRAYRMPQHSHLDGRCALCDAHRRTDRINSGWAVAYVERFASGSRRIHIKPWQLSIFSGNSYALCPDCLGQAKPIPDAVFRLEQDASSHRWQLHDEVLP